MNELQHHSPDQAHSHYGDDYVDQSRKRAQKTERNEGHDETQP